MVQPPVYSGPKSAYNLLWVVKKSEIPKVVDKTFDACKSAWVKKLCVRAAESYAGLSENKILEITNKHVKYPKFNIKFLNKAIPWPVRVSSVMKQVQIDLIHLSSRRVRRKSLLMFCQWWMYSVDFIGCLCYRESFLIMLLNNYLRYF